MANLPTEAELVAQFTHLYEAARQQGEDVAKLPPPATVIAQLLNSSPEEERLMWEHMTTVCQNAGVPPPERPPHLRR